MNREELIARAFEAMKNAYAPYSNYHVGAALLTKDGQVWLGANIENSSFGATNCAERSAVFAAYSNGVRRDDIAALAIVSDGDRIAAPCGICRQVLSELMPMDAPVWLSNGRDHCDTTIRELLPMAFGMEDVIR
ncbi:MAG: cytidine deaminase [Solobacterium sp.]|nr:cytidine deaminase [Solobacterium sp.]